MPGMITINKEINILSKREKQIVQLISQEYTTKGIADKLFIGEETVKTHRRNIQLKLDAKNAVGVICKAIEKRVLLIQL